MTARGRHLLHKDTTGEMVASGMLVLRTLDQGLNGVCHENPMGIKVAEHRFKLPRKIRNPVSYRHHVVGRLVSNLIAGEMVIIENKVDDRNIDKHIARKPTGLSETGLQVGSIIHYENPSRRSRHVIQTHPA